RRRFPLRYPWILEGCIREDGFENHRNGIRLRDGDQGQAKGDEGDGGAYHPESRRPVASSPPASLPGWLAASALHAPAEPALALPLSRVSFDPCGAGRFRLAFAGATVHPWRRVWRAYAFVCL